MDLNNNHTGTRSSKLRRLIPLRNYIMRSIDNNQNIKRLCRYYTLTPLLSKGRGYDGKMYNQPDLVDPLTLPIKNDTHASVTAQGRILYGSSFGGDVLDQRQITIYVHSPRSSFNPNMVNGRTNYGTDRLTGKHFFTIEIVYPTELNELGSCEQERANEIACEILDMLDERYVDAETSKYTGDCQFHVEGEYSDLRLSTSGYMVMTIPIWVSVFSIRTSKEKLGGETHYVK